jgi:hypothetical protein
MVDQREPYRDDFEEEFDTDAPSVTTATRTGQSEEGRGSLQPMAIGVEYSDEVREASRWKAKVAAALAVTFVAVGSIMTREYRANYYAPRHVPNVCDGYDADYFSEIMHHGQRATTGGTNSSLCSTNAEHSCPCHNPFEPVMQGRIPGWDLAMQQNIETLVSNYSDQERQPDFVLYGDSITERLLGRNFGHPVTTMQGKADVTYELFTKQGGGRVNGLPMGISGDEIAHLLYRMQNGEMPESLHPKLWWQLIGTNDLALGCSGDVVVAGNIRITEEIRQRHESHGGHDTDAPIIINSILPRGSKNLVSGKNPQWNIVQDVNQRLECYARITPDVYFANATEVFSEKRNGGIFAKSDYFERDLLHPNVQACRAWEEFIVQKVLSYLR